jgi:large subunit ribosomal protein L15
MLSLSTIKPAKGSTRQIKRVGRGNASGHGTYATRGMKGQRSRSGVSGLKRLGMKPMLLNIPKSRGFKSITPKYAVVNFTDLNQAFKENDVVSVATLKKAKLVDEIGRGVKLLANGNLKVKGLVVKGLVASAAARAELEKQGGKFEQ